MIFIKLNIFQLTSDLIYFPSWVKQLRSIWICLCYVRVYRHSIGKPVLRRWVSDVQIWSITQVLSNAPWLMQSPLLLSRDRVGSDKFTLTSVGRCLKLKIWRINVWNSKFHVALRVLNGTFLSRLIASYLASYSEPYFQENPSQVIFRYRFQLSGG